MLLIVKVGFFFEMTEIVSDPFTSTSIPNTISFLNIIPEENVGMRRSEGTSLDIEMNALKQEEVPEVIEEEEEDQTYVSGSKLTIRSNMTLSQSGDTIAIERSFTSKSLMLTSMDIQENKDIVALDSCHYSNPHYYESDDEMSVVDAEYEATKQAVKQKTQDLDSEVASSGTLVPEERLAKKEMSEVNTKMMGIWGLSRMKLPESSGEEDYSHSFNDHSTTQSESDSLPRKLSFHSFNRLSFTLFLIIRSMGPRPKRPFTLSNTPPKSSLTLMHLPSSSIHGDNDITFHTAKFSVEVKSIVISVGVK